MDKYTLRQNIADYTCKHFFDGKASLKGKIIKDLAALDSDTLMDYYVTLKNLEDYILAELRKMDAKNSFKFPYGRFKYLYGMVQRLIKESRQQKEPPAPKHDPKQELGQSDPIAEDTLTPSPQPKAATRPSWLDELEADSQPPKQASIEDAPVITESDLFESEPDTMHEAWAKLSEDEQRRNWATAIAGHQQQRKPEYAPDEMY